MIKHLLNLFFFIAITFNVTATSLKIIDPLRPWNEVKSNIDSALITITPMLYYAQVDLELNYSAKNTYYASYTNTSLEVVQNFNIPKNTIVLDSWLWIEDYISEAYLIDLYTATNVYESYVTRTQDPSLLRYNKYTANNLDFNIYPLPPNEYRKVKLSFLVPIINESSSFSINPIVDIFAEENENAASYCKVIINNSINYSQVSLRIAPTEIISSNTLSNTKEYEINMNAIDENFRIVYQNKNSNNQFSLYTSNNNEGYYYFEKYVTLDMNNCTIGSLNKVMDAQSFTHNVFNSNETYTNGVQLKESGVYYNNPPQYFVLEYACNNVVTKDTLNITPLQDYTAEKIWAKNYIDNNIAALNNNSYYYNPASYDPNYADIILTSMEHRVLSKYTAFLALPQEDTVVASLDGGATTNENVFVTSIMTDEYYLEEGFNINCYPNPMRDYLKIEIKHLNTENLYDIQSKIVDIQGKVVKEFAPFDLTSNTHTVLEWNGNNFLNVPVQSGVYFFVITTKNKTYTHEIMKL